jgi:hypothetical protein
VLATLVAGALVDYLSYARFQVLGRPVAPHTPFWVPICVVILAGGISAVLLARRAGTDARFLGVARTMLVLASLGVAAALTFLNWGVPTALQYAPTPAATHQAVVDARTSSLDGACHIVRRAADDLLPVPYQECAVAWMPGVGPDEQVTYLVNWDQSLLTPSEYGFAYSPGAEPFTPDACVRYVGGPWWDILGQARDDPQSPCPPSFEFQGAP